MDYKNNLKLYLIADKLNDTLGYNKYLGKHTCYNSL